MRSDNQALKKQSITLLSDYTPFEQADEQFQREFLLQLQDASTDLFDRNNFTPGHITASALIVDSTGEHILLQRHKKLNKWIQPGGHFSSPDKNICETAIREALEETGLKSLLLISELPFLVSIFDFPQKGTDPAHKHFDLCFLFAANRNEQLVCNAESYELKWISLKEFDSIKPDAQLDRMMRRWLQEKAAM